MTTIEREAMDWLRANHTRSTLGTIMVPRPLFSEIPEGGLRDAVAGMIGPFRPLNRSETAYADVLVDLED